MGHHGLGKGRRCGGKGRGCRAPPRSGGRGRRPPGRCGGAGQPARPAYAGAPPPLPEDASAPFLHPAPRPLVQVPLEFASLRHWCDVIGNNILAEFWHVFREARPVFSGYCTAAGGELRIDNAPADGLSQHLLLVDRQPCIATSQRILGVGSVAVKVRGGSVRSGSVRSIGYIGSYLAEFAAILELRKLPPQELTGPMRAILEPKIDIPGDFSQRPIRASVVPVNPSQATAIRQLQHALEKIQGPPGTGKSTTIFHILDARVPPGQRVLVTCSRNVAVESIAQKLAGLEEWPLCVFGPSDRVGETARRHLLDVQVGGHVDERKVVRVSAKVVECASALKAAIAAREAACRGCRGERLLRAFLRKRHAAAYGLVDYCGRLAGYCDAAAVAPEWCKEQAHAGKDRVLGRARIFLCTIASTSRMLREWEETMGEELRVHTVVVDECGCTPESSTALLLRLRPRNLLLVGDHKQLPPCSLVPPQALEGSGHTRSLLERCVLASGSVHQLREQYRMHPAIGTLVSDLFYAGRLSTPGAVARARTSREARPLVWHDVQGREEAPERSYVNAAEVQASVRACARLRERVAAGASVALLTFYRGQLDQLMRSVPSELNVEVLTVDACQGSEFDYVVLSTVRANREQRLGFVKDPQRICVAISRSRLQLLIVGNRSTLAGDKDWLRVQQACSPSQPQETRPERSLPAIGSFTSVFDLLRKQKDEEAAQKAAAALEEEAAGGKGSSARTGKGKGKSLYRGGRAEAPADALMWQQGSFRGARGVVVERRRETAYDSGSYPRAAPYRPPKTEAELEAQFPELGAAPEARPQPQRLPRGAGDLRRATRNDEKRARRFAQKAAIFAAEAAAEPEVCLASDLGFGAAAPSEEQWENVDEVVLFEMFPDDADAVEEALRRFAGMTHQGARALEALLARPIAAPSKKVMEVEDDLDYDCAADVDEGDEMEGDDEYADDEDEGEEQEREEAEDLLVPDLCAACSSYPAEDVVADDGLFYCAWCWAEWSNQQALVAVADGFVEAPATPVAQSPEVSTAATVSPCPKDEKAARPSERPSGGAPRGGRAVERIAFFEALDGIAKWAEAPARPEAGGKELVTLAPKEARGVDEAAGKKGRRFGAGADGLPAIPAAALAPAAAVVAETRAARCKRLLGSLEPSVEEDVVDYISSLLDDDESEDINDARDAALEILEGHGVDRGIAETFWAQLIAV